MNVAVIGLGVIGNAVFKSLHKKLPKNYNLFGLDINKKIATKLKKRGYNVCSALETPADIYIICLYSTKQVINIVKNLDFSRRPLVIIESTLAPGTHKTLVDMVVNKNKSNLLLFPRRLHKGDCKHQVFNLKRVMAGATPSCLKRGLDFYSKLMARNFIIRTTLQYAEMSKIIENAYRFAEISLAEEIKMICEENGLDFEELRRCANTKWNINIKEARDGIYGGCLLKDVKILNKSFRNSMFIQAVKIDKKYKKRR